MGATSKLKKQLQKNNPQAAPPPKNTLGLASDMVDPETQGQVPENKKRQVEDLTAMFIQFVHGEKTRDSVMQILESAPDQPEKAVAAAANNVMNRVEGMIAQRRMKIDNDVKLTAATYLVSDLALLGNKAGVWERQLSQEELQPVLKEAIQFYIQRGLKNKTIDPIELQREAEALMTPEQREIGLKYGQEGGVPAEPTEGMAIRRFADQAAAKEQQKTSKLAAENQELRSALQGVQQQAAAEQQNPSALLGQ